MKNVLVSAVAGDIGLPVAKILHSFGHNVIGCDAGDPAPARAFIKDVLSIPAANQKNYWTVINQIIDEKKIDVFIINNERELKYYQKNIDISCPCNVMALNRDLLSLFTDKFKTATWLRENGFPVPKSVEIKNILSLNLPIIIKKKSSSGGRDIIQIKSASSIEKYFGCGSEYFAQEEIGSLDQEYTCGVFSALGQTRVIAILRTLAGGITHRGEVVDNPEISALCEAIASKSNLFGSLNIQLRMTNKGPVIFEINPRFSSTVMFRHLVGFKDVIWWLDAIDGKKPSHFHIKPGTKIYRTGLEIVAEPNLSPRGFYE